MEGHRGEQAFVVYWTPSFEMDAATEVQNLHETICISCRANTHGKGINSFILPSAMGKQ